MLLKKIKLENIRSYLNTEIDFPIGSVLLAGDIGCGKTTILLAIEFALFGVRRKHLPAESLLRNGKKSGSVELKFSINKKDVIIKRFLKRAKNDIKQESGYIIKDGVKKEGTAVELKSMILNLLGYPSELLTKTKNLVYRYTVYTPQEEMKLILYDEDEGRLDTLRKVFGIDKYKKIRENSTIFLRELRERKRVFEGKISNLEEKKLQLKERSHELKELIIKIDEIIPKQTQKEQELKNKKDELKKIESAIIKLNDLKSEFEVCNANILNRASMRKNNNEKIAGLVDQLKVLRSELSKRKEIDKNKLKKEIAGKEIEENLMEKTIQKISYNLNEFEIWKKGAQEIKNKIAKIDKCPTCEQDVTIDHKDFINKRENKKLETFDKDKKIHSQQKISAEKKLLQIKKDLNLLKNKEREIDINLLKINNLEEKETLLKNLNDEQEILKTEVGKYNEKKVSLNKKIIEYQNIEKIYTDTKRKIDSLFAQERKLAIDKISMQKEKEGISKIISLLNQEIDEKLKIKDQLVKIRDLTAWVDEFFGSLMHTMEKHVMLKVYREFNELFQTWFNVLIEDEGIVVRLDDSFSPIIEQNGYELKIENLSGGEKTSCALAYRVALNKVVNDFIGDIKTKDLIILDEPTEGFSSEQLDKVRVVLEQLNTNQTIIVSHESKIESFVDSIIRINKVEHISNAI